MLKYLTQLICLFSDLGPKSVYTSFFAPEVKFTFILPLPRLEEGEYLENLEISVKMGHHFEVLLGDLSFQKN